MGSERKDGEGGKSRGKRRESGRSLTRVWTRWWKKQPKKVLTMTTIKENMVAKRFGC